MITAMNCANADIVVCSHTNYNTNDKLVNSDVSKNQCNDDYIVYDRLEALQALAMFYITSYVWNKMYKKSLWERIRFPEGHVYEDIATTFRVLDSCRRVCVLRDSLYLRRIRPNSITNSISEKSINDCLSACISFENYIIDNTPTIFSSDHLKCRQSSRLNQMIQYYLQFFHKPNSVERKEYQNVLRKQIEILGRKIGLGCCSFRSKCLYFSITKCYSIIELVYSLYTLVHIHLYNLFY